MKRAIVLLSGGMDSATCLAIAQRDGFEVVALTVDYGQRHRVEIERARALAAARRVADHRIIAVAYLRVAAHNVILLSESVGIQRRCKNDEGRDRAFQRFPESLRCCGKAHTVIEKKAAASKATLLPAH